MVYVFDAPITGSTFSLFFFFAEGDNDDDGQISKCKVKTKAFPCITMINLILPYHIIPSIFHRIKRTHRIALDGRTTMSEIRIHLRRGRMMMHPKRGIREIRATLINQIFTRTEEQKGISVEVIASQLF